MAFKMKSPLRNSSPNKFMGGLLSNVASGVNKIRGVFGGNRNRGNEGSARGFAQKAASGAFGSLFMKKGKYKK
tara:strand:+ start:1660 stop:1878 length:219 start_codon:yes stop_codon:yes gene_type:complete